MAIPVYLWLHDDGGVQIKGSVDIYGRENSVEVIELMNTVMLKTDNSTGKITSTRIHSGFAFAKEVDSSSPYLYKSLNTGSNLKLAEFKFYRINDSGFEEEHFNIKLENARVKSVSPYMLDTKDDSYLRRR